MDVETSHKLQIGCGQNVANNNTPANNFYRALLPKLKITYQSIPRRTSARQSFIKLFCDALQNKCDFVRSKNGIIVKLDKKKVIAKLGNALRESRFDEIRADSEGSRRAEIFAAEFLSDEKVKAIIPKSRPTSNEAEAATSVRDEEGNAAKSPHKPARINDDSLDSCRQQHHDRTLQNQNELSIPILTSLDNTRQRSEFNLSRRPSKRPESYHFLTSAEASPSLNAYLEDDSNITYHVQQQVAKDQPSISPHFVGQIEEIQTKSAISQQQQCQPQILSMNGEDCFTNQQCHPTLTPGNIQINSPSLYTSPKSDHDAKVMLLMSPAVNPSSSPEPYPVQMSKEEREDFNEVDDEFIKLAYKLSDDEFLSREKIIS